MSTCMSIGLQLLIEASLLLPLYVVRSCLLASSASFIRNWQLVLVKVESWTTCQSDQLVIVVKLCLADTFGKRLIFS